MLVKFHGIMYLHCDMSINKYSKKTNLITLLSSISYTALQSQTCIDNSRSHRWK